MGSENPVAVARSKRGIAGSIIMTTFDRHCLANFMVDSKFAAKKGSLESTSMNTYGTGETGSLLTETALGGGIGSQVSNLATVGSELQIAGGSAVTTMSKSAAPMYTDQILPFDVTLMGSNEYSTDATAMRVFAVEILNEGTGVSIDDTSNEVQITYLARLISPWVGTH